MDRTTTIALTFAALFCASCGGDAQRITVGSKSFTEQVLLGELIAQHIETRTGIEVDRKLNLGGTLLAHEALRGGSIDLYPEYTGTALTAVLKDQPQQNTAAVLQRVRSEYERRWQLTWLPPLGFENTFAMVVQRSVPARTLSEAAKLKRDWRLGAGFEFVQRPDGLPGLLRTYDLQLQGAPLTMDLGLLYRALSQGQVDMAAGNSTDGLLSVLPLKTLQDDKRYFPPYECAIVVRQSTLERFPQLRSVLEELSGTLSSEAMQRLNYAVDGERKTEREVAAEFLRTVRTASR